MKKALDLFGISGKAERLSGGQGQAFRVADYVIKSVTETAKYNWVGEMLESIETGTNLRISKPLRSKSGNFVEDGYGITHYLEGEFVSGNIRQKYEASVLLSKCLKSVKRPDEWTAWHSPWQWANQIAWGESTLPLNTHQQSKKLIMNIQTACQPITLPEQLIHADLAGNILFYDNIPIIIDFSPDFRPAAYADILLITDSIAWHNADSNSLWLTDYSKDMVIQLALRAVIFRLAVSVIFHPENPMVLLQELKNFEPVLNLLM